MEPLLTEEFKNDVLILIAERGQTFSGHQIWFQVPTTSRLFSIEGANTKILSRIIVALKAIGASTNGKMILFFDTELYYKKKILSLLHCSDQKYQ